MRIKGSGASAGIALGKAFVLPTWEWEMSDQAIDVHDLAKEFERLYEGIRSSKDELEHIKHELVDVIGQEESTIFDAHMAILDDPVFMSEVQGIIRRQYKAAEVAVKEAIEKFANMFDLLDDEYMKERAMDIKDVGNRLIKHLIGMPEITLPDNNQPFILVAKELTPSQLAHLSTEHVLGIVTMTGGRTSHSVIMARAMGIPFVIGFEGGIDLPIQTGDMLIIDGDCGILHIHPDEPTIQAYQLKKQSWLRKKEQLLQIMDVPTVTRDGVEVRLEANMNSVKEIDKVLQSDVGGVGLLRTEFLFLDRDTMPSEDEQFEAYREAVERLDGKPITIRTLDIGGDKRIDYIYLPEEENPFLGYRAIRVCLNRLDMFKTQLRAIIRASHYGNVKIMYPLISSVEEVRKANDLLEQAKEELRQEGVPFADEIKVGIMIEVPSAVIIADLLAKEVDFFSIGTNDLVQYILAVDRMNENIASYYEPFHPAVMRMLNQLAAAAHQAGIELSVCGEMAGDVRAVPIWLGLGIHDLSMTVQSLLPVKQRILELQADESKALLQEVLRCESSEQVLHLLDQRVSSTC